MSGLGQLKLTTTPRDKVRPETGREAGVVIVAVFVRGIAIPNDPSKL